MPAGSAKSYAPHIQLVVKISKYCNLRCRYCYEYDELGNKARMPLESLRKLFLNVRDAIEQEKISGIEFVWHGGEPFLIPISYYIEIGKLQKDLFRSPENYRNVVQTNLTVLTDAHIDFLKYGGFFDNIGVSFDVFGDQRVDKLGSLRNDTVLANLQKLIDNNINFAAITVLCRDTYLHTRKIQRFWEELGVRFRFLPFHLSIDDESYRRILVTEGVRRQRLELAI
jgi:uncharacterized protein